MDAIIMIVFTLSNIACFIIGAKTGQIAAKGKDIPFASTPPIKPQADRRAEKKHKAEQDMLRTILENVDAYDGTGFGQKELPRRE